MPEQSTGQTKHPVDNNTGAAISCAICGALYKPSRSYEHILQAPPVMLESALMSMCHFCFRCRRPACPECWDEVHGICGECVQETHLSFRVASDPLSSLLLTSSRQAQLEREHVAAAPLICVRPGRFRDTPQPPVDRVSTLPMKIVTGGKKREQVGEIRAQQHVQKPSQRIYRPPAQMEVDEVDTLPERGKQASRKGRGKRIIRAIRWVVITILSIILLTVVGLIVVAVLSEEANAFAVDTFRIDIRAEIAYLWQLITHLF